MLIQPNFPLILGLRATWHGTAMSAALALCLSCAHVFLDWHNLRLPPIILSVLGTAVAFYLGFKGNSAYDRLWEARKIWGGIVNVSRTWATHTLSMVSDPAAAQTLDPALAEAHRVLIYRHMGWLAALRTQLRRRQVWEHQGRAEDAARKGFGTFDMSDHVLRERLEPFVAPEDLDGFVSRQNTATHLLLAQELHLKTLLEQGRLNEFRHLEMARLVETMFTLQGKCERIKNFPLPRQYATLNHWFVLLFVALVPATLTGVFHNIGPGWTWASVPASAMLAWVFLVWDRTVNYTENPFEGLASDVPIDSLARTIEIDLREMLGESNLPAPLEPKDYALF